MPRTAYSPKAHEELASASAGDAYGHVPGHKYHDVDVVISRRGERYRCHVVESAGSAQGYDEEHWRREAIGRGDTIGASIENTTTAAVKAGIETEYLAQALSKARDKAEEFELDEAE